ncbi:MAG: hypothetical protein GY796_35445, partial [Chloroflexi bacterium]|nr:hypothetical protein [Chloroflexota bacterium]
LQGPFDLTVLDKRLLTVTPAGNGTGTVTSNPVGIDCGADCTELVDPGTVVTLTAIADTGSTFTGWSGDCVGTGSCLLTMTETKHVTATFTTYTTATLPLSPSWNLIGLPVQPLTPLTAQGLLDMVNSQGNTCTEIARWHNGGWDSHIDGMPFNNFTIEMGHGYFVECTGFGSWDLPGTTLSSSVALSIQASWNLIAIPYSSGYTAQTLLDALNSQGNTCTEVDRWQSGGWDSHIDGLPFNDFTIEVDEGYFVSCSSGGSFTP